MNLSQLRIRDLPGVTILVFGLIAFVLGLAVVRGIAPGQFIMIGVWELVGALATWGALVYHRRRAAASSS